jgi:hypothetical protein
MSIAAISSSVPVLPQAEVQKASTPVPAQSTPASADTVSISAGGHQAASAGDAGHDGDSH